MIILDPSTTFRSCMGNGISKHVHWDFAIKTFVYLWLKNQWRICIKQINNTYLSLNMCKTMEHSQWYIHFVKSAVNIYFFSSKWFTKYFVNHYNWIIKDNYMVKKSDSQIGHHLSFQSKSRLLFFTIARDEVKDEHVKINLIIYSPWCCSKPVRLVLSWNTKGDVRQKIFSSSVFFFFPHMMKVYDDWGCHSA